MITTEKKKEKKKLLHNKLLTLFATRARLTHHFLKATPLLAQWLVIRHFLPFIFNCQSNNFNGSSPSLNLCLKFEFKRR